MQSTKSKPLWRSPFTISLIAAVFTAVYKAMDNITVHNLFKADDGLTAAFAYLVVGAWTGVVFSLLFALIFGKRLVDPDFNGFIVKNSFMQSQAFISGLISAGSTLFLLWGNQFGDPSVLISLGSGVILYTAFYDVATKQIEFAKILLPLLLVFVGSLLATYGGGSLYVSLAGILLVLILSNGLSAFSEIVEQRGVRKSDGVNFFFWRFFWLAFTGTILAFVISFGRGYLDEFLSTAGNAIQNPLILLWIAFTMLFVFLGIGMKLNAKKEGAISIVLITLSAQLILGYPITIVGNLLRPGVFGAIPLDYGIWGIRILGAALIIMAIYKTRSKRSA